MSLQADLFLQKGNFNLNLKFELHDREILGVVGRSGNGKTTLLRALAGLEKKCRGRVKVFDEIWQEESFMLPTHKRSLGLVFQGAHLFPHLNVKDNLYFGHKRTPEKKKIFKGNDIIDLLNLGPLLPRNPEGLSGGEKQRVSIGRSLLSHPQVLFLDEPLAALDRRSKKEVLPYFKKINQELHLPILYVAHQTEELALLGNRILWMEKGRLKKIGDVPEILREYEGGESIQESSVIRGTIKAHNPDFHFSTVSFSGGEIITPLQEKSVGDGVSLQIFAQDVGLALRPPEQSSVSNVLIGKVVSTLIEENGKVKVGLLVGEFLIFSMITFKSFKELNIKVGDYLYVLIKAVSFSL